MGVRKSRVKKGSSRPQDSGLFGIVDKVISTNRTENTIVNLPVPLNHQARKLAMAPTLEAEYYKVQAIALLRQASIR